MSQRTLNLQVRLNSLGRISTPLTLDGEMGDKTAFALKEARKHMGKTDILDPSGIYRIHWHWTASTYEVTPKVLSHYNDVFGENGEWHKGCDPLEQAKYDWRKGIGVSHTKNANTNALGLAVASCAGRTADWHNKTIMLGEWPMTWPQIGAMLQKTAEYCKRFDIVPSKWTTLTHAEVQTYLVI